MRIAIAGGGTGGHLFPAIALAQEFSKRGHELFFIGNRGRIEEIKVPEYGYEIEFVKGGQVKGVGVIGAVKGLAATFLGLLSAYFLLGRKKPDAVVGVGGYASVAAVLAGRLRKKPTALCEQNSVPGRANRFLSRFAKKVFTAYEEAREMLPENKVECLGNPIRIDFKNRFEAARKKKLSDQPCLLVFGGSLGARKLNHAVLEAVEIWKEKGSVPRIIHQTGKLDHSDVLAQYEKLGVSVDCRDFVDDMAETYGKADLVLARAGAMSISEIAACALPSILVPLPWAADDHQRKNAAAIEKTGGAMVVENDGLTGEKIVTLVDEYFSNIKQLSTMGKMAGTFDRPMAAKHICDGIESLVKEN